MNWIIRWFIKKQINNTIKRVEKGGDFMKPGITTSEALVTIIVAVLTVLSKALNLPEDVQKSLIALAIAYVSSRTIVKVGNEITNGKK